MYSHQRQPIGLVQQEKIEEFVQAIRTLMVASRDRADPVRLAEREGLSDRQIDFIVKTAVEAGSTSASTWAAPLSVNQLAAAFVSSLVGKSVFETVRGSSVQVPPRATVVAVAGVGAASSVVPEGHVKAVGNLSISSQDAEPQKSVAIFVVSDELLRMGGS